jgi:hypothetical protein
MNRILYLAIIAWLLTVALLIAAVASAQDSVAVKVIDKPFTIGDTTYYKLRVYGMGRSEVVLSQCCCKDRAKRRKGEIVMIAKKDLILTHQ